RGRPGLNRMNRRAGQAEPRTRGGQREPLQDIFVIHNFQITSPEIVPTVPRGFRCRTATAVWIVGSLVYTRASRPTNPNFARAGVPRISGLNFPDRLSEDLCLLPSPLLSSSVSPVRRHIAIEPIEQIVVSNKLLVIILCLSS